MRPGAARRPQVCIALHKLNHAGAAFVCNARGGQAWCLAQRPYSLISTVQSPT
jgi:hypothetical protein